MKSEASPNELVDIDCLWKQLREGDRKGLEGLYRHFAKMLFQYGLSMVRDKDFIDDCVQEVFIDIWKYHKNLQQPENVKLYFFRSLRNKIYRESLNDRKWKKVALGQLLESCFSAESEESRIISAQREELLQKKLAVALGKLPVRQKEVIHYLFFESFSYEETSTLMGINLKSVYTLAWKAISSLKKNLLLILFIWFAYF